ncbi:3'-5' exoribonuclease [Novosphingobium sp. YJ-S2-02]|uniref:3'-5' exoribonuclease n=1 Tax=Novosphingobium aureum TaxID=2792964 RepID=A0A931HCF5_9SPHN|nr:3'-5' exonuclease [Novosphingobium aureum]MBH0113239.1 3'-5' exoribonuclease [Novosphingobium aureum]
MKTVNVMIDDETWGLTPGSDLRSVGACVFDPKSGYVAESGPDTFYLATENPVARRGLLLRKRARYPLTRDPATVDWWNGQSAEARAAFARPVDLAAVLEMFTHWLLAKACPDQPLEKLVADLATGWRPRHLRIWSHGANFDPGIMEAAFRAVGLPVPWFYRSPRDTRTCFDDAGIADHEAWLAQHPGPLGILHHALDDAICQARAVCSAQWILADALGRRERELVRHARRGGLYDVLGQGELQSARQIAEGESMTVYRSLIDGRIWVRPSAEFRDGRFSPVMERVA